MSIPYASTTISVLRMPDAQFNEEPYQTDTEATRTVVAAGVRAVIWAPGSERQRKQVKGGEQALIKARLTCDITDLRVQDWVKDATTGEIWKIDSVAKRIVLGLDHLQAELYLYVGVV